MQLQRATTAVAFFLATTASSLGGQTWVAKGSTLRDGQILRPLEYLQSPGKTFFLVMTQGGSLVIMKGSSPSENYGFVWSPNNNAASAARFAMLTTDGRLTIRGGTSLADTGPEQWTSDKKGAAGPYFLYMQDDGNLGIYKGTSPSASGGNFWSSGTNTAVTWVAHPVRIVNEGTGQAINWSPGGSTGDRIVLAPANAAKVWGLGADYLLRFGPDKEKCITYFAGGVLMARPCGEASRWTLNPADHTLRPVSLVNSCIGILENGTLEHAARCPINIPQTPAAEQNRYKWRFVSP